MRDKDNRGQPPIPNYKDTCLDYMLNISRMDFEYLLGVIRGFQSLLPSEVWLSCVFFQILRLELFEMKYSF